METTSRAQSVPFGASCPPSISTFLCFAIPVRFDSRACVRALNWFLVLSFVCWPFQRCQRRRLPEAEWLFPRGRPRNKPNCGAKFTERNWPASSWKHRFCLFLVCSEREECLCEPAYSTHIFSFLFSFLFSFFPGRLILSFLLA